MAASASHGAVHFLACVTLALIMVLVARPLLRRVFGARIAYAFWTVVPLVMIAAILPPVIQLPTTVLPEVAERVVPNVAKEWLADAVSQGVEVSAWLFATWVSGAAAFLAVQVWQQHRFMRRLGPLQATASGEWVTRTPAVGPAVIGMFPSRIVLPEDFRERYTADEQDLILAHERMHLRRHDLIVSAVAVFARAVLWFHPLVHFAARCLRMDQELACDAAVLAERPESRSAYAQAILKTHVVGLVSSLGCRWESRTASSLERRFKMLKKVAPERSRTIVGHSLVGLLAVVAAGLTWADQPQGAQEPEAHSIDLDQLIIDPVSGKRALLIDGRRSTLNEVRKIPLSRIERIEVLPMNADVIALFGPDVKKGGVINIVLMH